MRASIFRAAALPTAVGSKPAAALLRLELRVSRATLGALALLLLDAGCALRPATTTGDGDAAVARQSLWLNPDHPEWRRPAPPVSHIRFETTKGVFVLELVRAWGPIGADRLYNLARLGYYDDTRVHRVRRNYIAQFGLHGDPAVNAAWKDRYLADDALRSTNTRGTFAFAMKGQPNTRNTQIYINLADNPRSDAEAFTVLGTVIEGMMVLDSLYSGYGDESGSGVRQGRQGPLESGGNAYMDREFPLLDRIRRATVRDIRRDSPASP
jgi:homoserine O-acetyltransferase